VCSLCLYDLYFQFYVVRQVNMTELVTDLALFTRARSFQFLTGSVDRDNNI